MLPVMNAFSPRRWQISRAFSGVTRVSGGCPIKASVARICASGNTLRNGDCWSWAAGPSRGAVEQRVAGAIGEVGEQDRVLLGQDR